MGFLEQFAQSLVDGSENKRIQEFTLVDAWCFFLTKCKEYPKAKKCIIQIERKGNSYEIIQVLLTAKNDPVRVSDAYAVGQNLRVFELGEDLIEFMDGKTQRTMYLSALINAKE